MDAEDDPDRARLARLVEQLSEQVESERAWLKNREPIPSLINWFVMACREYLAGKHPSMDHALGLKHGRGRPKGGPVANYDRAKRVFEMRAYEGKSWRAVAEEFQDTDVRELQREQARHEEFFLAELRDELSKRA